MFNNFFLQIMPFMR